MATTPEQLGKAMQDTPFDVEALMSAVTLAAQAASQKRSPVKTGTLRRSLTTRVEAEGLRGFVGTNVRYASFVHNGTKFMTSRPFIAEGIADTRPTIAKLLAEAGNEYLAQFGDI